MKKTIIILILLSMVLGVFGQTYTLTVNSKNIGGGDGAAIEITPPKEIITSSKTYTFAAGESVLLQARGGDVGTGYCPPYAQFSHWEGDWTEDTGTATGTVIMDQNRIVTAYFNLFNIPCSPPSQTTFFISPQAAAEGDEIAVPVEYLYQAVSYKSNPQARLHYNSEIFELVLSRGDNGFERATGDAEYVEPGTINLSASSSVTDITQLFGTFYFKALKQGTTTISISDPYPDDVNFIRALSVPFIITSNGTTALCGDVNGDEEVTIVDAFIIACYFTQIILPEELNLDVADVNCSGEVNILDALIIAQYSVGLGVTLNCCQ